MKKINTAVIGFGMAAREFHIPAIVSNDKFNLYKVMTRSPKNQKDLSELYPQAKLITSFDEAINDPDVDLVVIATANDVHYEYTKKALNNKKHVVCEKPFVETYKKAKELYDLAFKNKVNLKVFHNRKYDGDILTLKELMANEDFGRLIQFDARFDRLKPNIGENWRFKKEDMAGIFYDLAPHLVHHSIDLFGMPKSVTNHLYYDRDGAIVDDHFEMILNYENGFKSRLGALMLEREAIPKIKLEGTLKTYSKYGFDTPDSVNEPVNSTYQTDELRSVLTDDTLNESNVPLLLGKHYLFYDIFGTEVNEKTLVSVDNNLALGVVLVLEKALESHEKRKTIDIPKLI